MIGLILVAAGSGSRLKSRTPKQFLPLAGIPAYLHSLRTLSPLCQKSVVVVPNEWVDRVGEEVKNISTSEPVIVKSGGATRQQSVLRGFDCLGTEISCVIVHDAARPFVTADLAQRTIQGLSSAAACIPGIEVAETVKSVQDGLVSNTLNRSNLRLIQTPQAFQRAILARAFESASTGNNLITATDEATLVEALGEKVLVIEGDRRNVKITWKEDLQMAIGRDQILDIRVGNGYDFHPFKFGRPLILGGVPISHPKGLDGHSDADALLHACCDAILGASGLPDIGTLFPDDEPKYKGISSLSLLQEVLLQAGKKGYRVGNIDITILAEEPTIKPYVEQIKCNLAQVLQLAPSRVGLKATTMEGKGPIGRGEGLAAQVIVSLIPLESTG